MGATPSNNRRIFQDPEMKDSVAMLRVIAWLPALQGISLTYILEFSLLSEVIMIGEI